MFKSEFEREYTWLNGFMRNVYRFADKEAMILPKQRLLGHVLNLIQEVKPFFKCDFGRRNNKRRSSDVPTFELPGICVCIYRLS